MRGAVLALFFVLTVGNNFDLSLAARPFATLREWLGVTTATKSTNGDNWALLIAGSAGWGNYRHQADVAHAYQVLHRGGIPDERIIVMVYDDIADSPENPRPGTLINSPDGEDVYKSLPKDYTKDNVNAETFLAVLTGNKSGVPPVGRHSTGRVIESTASDRVFVFYSDHGAPGIVGMPSGEFLYADQLHKAIKHLSQNNGFAELVFYLEACESGSMFKGMLEDDLGVYAITAANERESSWGTYCPGMDPAPPSEFSTCLGDLFSVSWMEDSDGNDLTTETLKKQYQKVRLRTSNNYTFTQGSHVERFGALEMSEEMTSDFLGELNTGRAPPSSSSSFSSSSASSSFSVDEHSSLPKGSETEQKEEKESRSSQVSYSVPQREADLLPLMVKAHRHAGTLMGDEAVLQLQAEQTRRMNLDISVLRAVRAVVENYAAIISTTSTTTKSTTTTETNNNNRVVSIIDLPLLGTELLMTDVVPAPGGSSALVDDWDCLRGMVGVWGRECAALDQYGMRHSRVFANLCNIGVSPEIFAGFARDACRALITSGDDVNYYDSVSRIAMA